VEDKDRGGSLDNNGVATVWAGVDKTNADVRDNLIAANASSTDGRHLLTDMMYNKMIWGCVARVLD